MSMGLDVMHLGVLKEAISGGFIRTGRKHGTPTFK